MLVSGLLTVFSPSVLATAPGTPADPLPANGGYWDYFIQNTTLSCNVTDPDGGTLTVTFFVDSTAVGTNLLVANDTRTYMNMGFLPTNYTTYYWHVTVDDGVTNVTGPTWMFKCAAKNGDIIQDGVVDSLDTNQIQANYSETGTPGWIRSDINNDGFVNSVDVSLLLTLYGNIYSSSLYPPTAVNATAVNTTAVNLSWTKGTGTTVDKTIVMSSSINFSSSPGGGFQGWTINNGTEIYNGTGTYYVNTVAQGSTTYYAFWTYNASERTYYPAYMSDVIRDVTTGYNDPAQPTGITVTGGYAAPPLPYTTLNVSWTAGTGITEPTSTVLYYDTVNHTTWLPGNGILLANTTNTSALLSGTFGYGVTMYFGIFSYNFTLNTYSAGYSFDATTPTCVVADIATFAATKYNTSAIDLSFVLPAGADAIYIEWAYDNPIIPWTIGDGYLAYNGTTSPHRETGLNSNRGYWYMSWGYNATYNIYSVIGNAKFARTDPSAIDRLLIGENYHDVVKTGSSSAMNFEWVNHIYPSGWYNLFFTSTTGLFDVWYLVQSSQFKSQNSHDKMLNILKQDYAEHVYTPYNWWSYWLDSPSTKLGNPDTTHFGESPNKVGKYAWHVISDLQSSEIEIKYDKNISGGIVGIGFFMFEAGQFVRASTPFYTPHAGFFPDYSSMPSPPNKNFEDVRSMVLATGIHLQINNQVMPMGILCQNGFDEYYGHDQFLYFDLQTHPIIIDNEKLLIELLVDSQGRDRDYAFLTTPTDIDDDGDKSIYFSVGNDAINNFNSEGLDGILDSNRDFNYFFIYNPNLHEGGGTSPLTVTDKIIVTPNSLGKYETTNIIYFLASTSYTTNLSIYAPSNLTSPVATYYLEVDRGNVFFTPTEDGVYTVTLTRNSVITATEIFQVLSQTPHGYVYSNANPAITNQLVTIKAYYDIADYPAAVRLETETGVLVTQWSINASASPYTFSYQVVTPGKYYIKMYQIRTYDEQMITQYLFYVKDREYVTSIVPSSYSPHINEATTVTVTSNIVGVGGMNLNYYVTNLGSAKKRIDTIGDKFITTIAFTPTTWTGQWDLKLELYIANVGTYVLSNASITVQTAVPVTPPPPSGTPTINVPNIISMAGPALGISDPMFRLIIGSFIVLIVMLLPLIIAWKAKLKYADRIITNPMVYSVTAIIGSLISYALGLFDLWVFVLIFIVALTFFIRAWRGQSSLAGGE